LKTFPKKFGALSSLVNLVIGYQRREMIGLLGRLGSGKTRWLRIIAGLEGADKRIQFATEMSPTCTMRDRRVRFCIPKLRTFSSYDGMPINVAFWFGSLARKERQAFLKYKSVSCIYWTWCSLLTLLRFPIALSGGQKQRIAGRSFWQHNQSTVN